MDDELTHIIFEIEDCFDRIEKEIYHIKRYDGGYRSYSFSFDYLDHYIWLINQLSTYTRALDHKLNEFNSNNENDEYDLYIRKYGPESDIDNYNTVTHNRDNGDME
jgi:hypothetical protein